MKIKKISRPVIGLTSLGLLMTLAPALIAHYSHISDFLRGYITGTGLGLEIMGFILLKRKREGNTLC
ncbi:MAG: hypothetical protein ACXVJD_07085 [Mucilaginibacter sp.]